MKKKKQGNHLPKTRYYQAIGYSESLVQNWEEILKTQFVDVKFLVSPLHNRDFNDDRSPKKPHFHFLCVFPNPRDEKAAMTLFSTFGAVFHMPEGRVISPLSVIEYFTHKNNPEKAQYNENDLKFINGFDIEDFQKTFEMTTKEIIKIKKDLIHFINDNFILTYNDFIDKIIEQNLSDKYLNIAMNSTIFFNNYIKGKWQTTIKS